MSNKPRLKYNQIWNLNFGYLGLQVCLSLVIANTSRIFSALGAETHELASLWLVAPLAGLVLQPIIGYASDRTWTALGRRIPYILLGVCLTAVMMFIMPSSHLLSGVVAPIAIGVLVFFTIQCALNLTMQPYRSLVGDMVSVKQTNLGYSVQTGLANIGGIVGASLPFVLTSFGFDNEATTDQEVASSVVWSFYIGVLFLLITGLWTCFSVKEYPPQEFEAYNKPAENSDVAVNGINEDRQAIRIILQLSVVQFFSWFAFYYLWVYATDGIAYTVWHTHNPLSVAYNNAGNWFGIMTGVYCIVATLFSTVLPTISDRLGRKNLYSLALFIGGMSFITLPFLHNQYVLLIPMIGVGVAWAMTLTVPFALLASFVPAHKMGLYMGLLNITIVIPQLVAGMLGSTILEYIANGNAIAMLTVAGMSLLIASLSVMLLDDNKRRGSNRASSFIQNHYSENY
ncbi:MAG: hypothetical protein RL662_523 [Bacteroidota bacterium]|jgi:maltose/moltooligosaccharide transporter